MSVADYPKLKKENRTKLHRAFYQAAFPVTDIAAESLTTEEFAARLSRAINGK